MNKVRRVIEIEKETETVAKTEKKYLTKEKDKNGTKDSFSGEWQNNTHTATTQRK